MQFVAATWCSIRRCTRRPIVSTRCCGCLPSEEKPIGQWFPVRLHHAAAEVGARIVLLDDKPIAPGAEADVQLVLDQPIAAGVHDRFVVRDVSAQRTIGGGKFIDLRAPARKRRTPERHAQRAALALDDPRRRYRRCLRWRRLFVDLTAFARDRALSNVQMERLAFGLGLTILESRDTRTALSPLRWKSFAQSLNETGRAISRRRIPIFKASDASSFGSYCSRVSANQRSRWPSEIVGSGRHRSRRRFRSPYVARGAACARRRSGLDDHRGASRRG